MHKNVLILSFLCLFILIFACKQNKPTKQTESFKTITTDYFMEHYNDPDVVVLDVRTPQEIAELGKVENAIQIDYYNSHFLEKVQNLDQDKTYFVYCKSGNRSAKASKIMQDIGFKNVNNVKDGFNQIRYRIGK